MRRENPFEALLMLKAFLIDLMAEKNCLLGIEMGYLGSENYFNQLRSLIGFFWLTSFVYRPLYFIYILKSHI